MELQSVRCTLAFRCGRRPCVQDVERKCRETAFAAHVLLYLHSHRSCCRTGSSKKQIPVFPCGQNICVQAGCKVDPGLLESLFSLMLKQTGMRVFLTAWCVSFLCILPFLYLPHLSFLFMSKIWCLFKRMKSTLDKEPFILLMLPYTWLGQGEPRRAIFWVPLRNVRLE